MASSRSSGEIDGKSNCSDNMSTVCGYKDINEFSQVANSYLHLIAMHVIE